MRHADMIYFQTKNLENLIRSECKNERDGMARSKKKAIRIKLKIVCLDIQMWKNVNIWLN